MKEPAKEKGSSAITNAGYYHKRWEDAGAYLNRSAGSRWYNYLIGRLLLSLDSNAVKRVIDAGCGVGNKTHFLAKSLPLANVVGYDFSEIGIKEAKRYFSEKNLHYIVSNVADVRRLGAADLITFFEVLEHVDDWKRVLTDSIDKSGARYVMIGSPTGKKYEGGIHTGHVLHFKRGQIEKYMKEKGYRPVKILYAGFPFVSPIFRDLSQLLQKQYDTFVQTKPTALNTTINTTAYILFRYFSTVRIGNQFIGLFERSQNN